MLKSSSLIPQLAFLYSFFDFLALFFFFYIIISCKITKTIKELSVTTTATFKSFHNS